MTSEADRALALLFADLAQKFGLSRPAGQCFAAIWRAAMTPSADDLTQICGLSRSGVSVALKELRAWGLIEVARSPGNRREFFTAPFDPWELARRIIAERQRRDLAPMHIEVDVVQHVEHRAALVVQDEALGQLADAENRSLGHGATPAEPTRREAANRLPVGLPAPGP